MPSFRVGSDVHQNVAELLKALGSVTRPLSYGDLAALLNERDPSRRRYASTVRDWAMEGVVPDLRSIKAMAELAGVSFEDFALGSSASAAQSPRADVPIVDREADEVPAPKRRPGGRKTGT